jgi:O-6-methylguanine DNA methyltransferase
MSTTPAYLFGRLYAVGGEGVVRHGGVVLRLVWTGEVLLGISIETEDGPVREDRRACAIWHAVSGMGNDPGTLGAWLSPAGTPFLAIVRKTLLQIPEGTVTTYGELAARIGRPGACRAVASAVAANPFAVLVPCHRVVRADGTSGGYRWGVAAKRQLLAGEGVSLWRG